ncbi:hypothetical protein EJ03DRAFT_350434 [Teratosphaeria nubilosa]|uniref:Uncharacterized protein n=1 Tax=Teratosphaeria nubilosa TaxID=161662 RepID=A0A6G1LCJ6_9PEZI|nr:hypothetical protein EJ03DRAFT_350434 [Teratosphaeria nubilosa]
MDTYTQPMDQENKKAQQQDLITQIQAALEPKFEELLRNVLREERGWLATAFVDGGDEIDDADDEDSDYHDGCDDAEYYADEEELAAEEDVVEEKTVVVKRRYIQVVWECGRKGLEVVRAVAKGVLAAMLVIIVTVVFLNCCEWVVLEWEAGRWG